MEKMLNRATHILVGKLNDFFLWGRIFTLICLLPLLHRLLRLKLLLKLLTPRNTKCPANQDQEKKIIKWTDAILGWDFFIFRSSCLKRSLVLYHFLKREGLPVQINFGVRKLKEESGQQHPVLDGHGWLSLRGRTYLEKGEPLKIFKLMYSFPPLQ
jgi:hypothetical protein